MMVMLTRALNSNCSWSIGKRQQIAKLMQEMRKNLVQISATLFGN